MVETVSVLRGRWGRKGGELIPEVTLVSPRHLPLSETVGPGARGVLKFILYLCLYCLSFPLGIR